MARSACRWRWSSVRLSIVASWRTSHRTSWLGASTALSPRLQRGGCGLAGTCFVPRADPTQLLCGKVSARLCALCCCLPLASWAACSGAAVAGLGGMGVGGRWAVARYACSSCSTRAARDGTRSGDVATSCRVEPYRTRGVFAIPQGEAQRLPVCGPRYYQGVRGVCVASARVGIGGTAACLSDEQSKAPRSRISNVDCA